MPSPNKPFHTHWQTHFLENYPVLVCSEQLPAQENLPVYIQHLALVSGSHCSIQGRGGRWHMGPKMNPGIIVLNEQPYTCLVHPSAVASWTVTNIQNNFLSIVIAPITKTNAVLFNSKTRNGRTLFTSNSIFKITHGIIKCYKIYHN